MARTYKPAPTYDFLRWGKPFGLISAILSVVCVMLLFYPGLNFNIDFTGGTNITVKFNGPVSDGDIRDAMSSIGINDAGTLQMGGENSGEYIIQTAATTTLSKSQREEISALMAKTFGEGTDVVGDDTNGDRFYVRLPSTAYGINENDVEDDATHINVYTQKTDALSKEIDDALATISIPEAHADVWGNAADRRFVVRVAGMHDTVQEALQAKFGDSFIEIERTETVGPRVGEQLRAAAITAVLWSMVLILLYIAFRFDIRFAPAAIIGEVHDILLVLGFIVIFKIEFSLTIIAALLTVVGYSVNDTIVNFDRIRENMQDGHLERGETLRELVNRSINECLPRTLLTSFTTLAALVAIIAFGGDVLRPFALVIAVGVVLGTYSSIYISQPIMLWTNDIIEKRQAKNPPVKKEKIKGPVV